LRKSSILICALALVWCQGVFAQKVKPRKGQVCGDPTAACRSRENFQPFDLPFDQGKNFVVAESEYFYGVVLESVKLPDFGDCEHPSFKEDERLEIQQLFEHNKVFMLNCVESASNYYPGVTDQTAFIAVYAGHTLAEANKFLRSVYALNRFPGIRPRRMRVAVNGT
jgi:hypothetical protein